MMVFTCSCCSIKVVGFGFRAAVRSSLVEYLQWIIQMEMFVWLHPTIKHSAYGNESKLSFQYKAAMFHSFAFN